MVRRPGRPRTTGESLIRDLLLDTSVVLKWFHRDGEDEVEQAEWHLQAHREGFIRAQVLDLGIYELGSILVRVLNRTASETAAVLDAVRGLCGSPLRLDEGGLTVAAEIACADGLTFYDAAFASAATAHGFTLISADRKLLTTGHALTLTRSIERLRGNP